MKTLVVTSINPRSRLDYQKACFNKWKEIGYVVKSYNCEEEQVSLLNHGFDTADVIKLTEGETAAELFGRGIPRILPVLNRAKNYDAESVILVNSDIYPAHKKPISSYLSTLAGAIALTREEFVEINNIRYTDSFHYRGGLDIFFFTSNGLSHVIDSLIKQPVAERMTFGVPGWDFFLGHQITFVHNGLIMDGKVLFHQYQKETYNQIDEFGVYAKQMYESGIYEKQEPGDLAREFSSYIKNQCVQNTRFSRLLNAMFYVKPAFQAQFFQSVLLVEADFEKKLKVFEIEIPYERNPLRGFIWVQLKEVDWKVAETYRDKELSQIPSINGYLLLLLLQLIIKKHLGVLNITDVYPKSSSHDDSLRPILNTTGEERLHSMIRLFSTDLIDHSIFNANLFKFILLSAGTPDSLNLCAAIFSFCKKR